MTLYNSQILPLTVKDPIFNGVTIYAMKNILAYHNCTLILCIMLNAPSDILGYQKCTLTLKTKREKNKTKNTEK